MQIERKAAEEQLEKKNLELQQVLSWARQNLLSSEELKPQLAQVREQRQHWQQEVRRLDEKLVTLQVNDDSLADAETFCRSISHRLAGFTIEQKRAFLRLVVKRIWVDRDNNLEIELIIPKPQEASNNVICETPLSLRKERGRDLKEGQLHS